MQVVILSPDKQVFQGEASSVKVPGSGGQFEILKNHAPIVSALSAGTIKVKVDTGESLAFQVDGGFVEVLNNEVSLLVTGLK